MAILTLFKTPSASFINFFRQPQFKLCISSWFSPYCRHKNSTNPQLDSGKYCTNSTSKMLSLHFTLESNLSRNRTRYLWKLFFGSPLRRNTRGWIDIRRSKILEFFEDWRMIHSWSDSAINSKILKSFIVIKSKTGLEKYRTTFRCAHVSVLKVILRNRTGEGRTFRKTSLSFKQIFL